MAGGRFEALSSPFAVVTFLVELSPSFYLSTFLVLLHIRHPTLELCIRLQWTSQESGHHGGLVGTFTPSQTPEEGSKLFFSGGKCTFGAKPFWAVKLLSLSALLMWTSCVSCLSTLRVLLLSICIWFLGFQAQVPSSTFDPRSLALRNSEELLGLLFCSSSGIAVLCCVFCLSPCLKQPKFSPELQLSAMGWTAFT